MRHIPSLKTLKDRFGQMVEHDYGADEAPKKLRELRKTLVAWRDGEIKSRTMLERANDILQAHGVEYIRASEDEYDFRRPHGAYYVNMGETYTSTLLLDIKRDRVWATTYGDWIEAEERAGNAFAGYELDENIRTMNAIFYDHKVRVPNKEFTIMPEGDEFVTRPILGMKKRLAIFEYSSSHIAHVVGWISTSNV